jgi:hypothetical protein
MTEATVLYEHLMSNPGVFPGIYLAPHLTRRQCVGN